MQENSNSDSTSSKALHINQDLSRYGAFAEIGAGQEVARHFSKQAKHHKQLQKRFLLMT